jgi:uncharacterized protein (DUF305 family)
MAGSVFVHRALAAMAGTAVLAFAGGCGAGDHSSSTVHGSAAISTTAPLASTATFNDADVTFAQNMIPHHQQALQMTDLAAGRGGDPEIKQLANQIKAAQDPEIKTMTGWLAAWGRPVEPPQGHGEHAMLGMMSDAEMGKLTTATGKYFDRMFTQLMIAHHDGAIQMARDEQANGANPEAKNLAATIERSQADEVAKLEKILDRL